MPDREDPPKFTMDESIKNEQIQDSWIARREMNEKAVNSTPNQQTWHVICSFYVNVKFDHIIFKTVKKIVSETK